MIYNKDVQEALAAGYSLDDIKNVAIQEYNEAIDAGYDRKVVREILYDTYGLSVGTSQQDLDDAQYTAALMFTPLEEEVSDSENKFNAEKYSIEKADSLVEALAAGWQNSVSGLASRGAMPSYGLSEDADFKYKVAFTAAQTLGDLPFQIVGGVIGGAVGSVGGPVGTFVGAGAGAGFVTEYLRNGLMDAYTNGQAATWKEYADRTVNNFIAGGKGAVVGIVAGGSSVVARPVIASATSKLTSPFWSTAATEMGVLGVEVSALTTTMASMEGRMPTAEDFALAGVTLGGFKLAGRYTDTAGRAVKSTLTTQTEKYFNRATNLYIKKFMDEYRLTGRTPEQVGQATLIDPQVKERVAAVNQRITVEEDSKFYTAFTPLKEGDVAKRGLDATKKYTEDEIRSSAATNPIDPAEYSGQWLYGSRRAASEGIKDATSPEAYTDEILIPKNAPYIRLSGNKDSTMAKVMREYMKTDEGRRDLEARDPDFFKENPDWWERFKTVADERIVPTARAMFENPSQAFIDFLNSHVWSPEMIKELTAGHFGDQAMPTAVRWQGLMRTDAHGTRYYVFKDRVMRPSMRNAKGDTPYEAALAEFQNKVSINENPGKTWSEVLDSLMYHVVDTFAALNKGARGGKRSEAYVDAIVSNGNAGRASFMIDFGTINWKGETVGKGLKDILSQVRANGGDLNEFSIYLTARSFKELNDRGISTAMDPDLTASILKGPRAHIYEPIAKEFKAFNDQVLQYTYEAGLITKARLDKLRREFKESVPLERLLEAFEPELQAEAVRTSEGIFGADKPDFTPDPKDPGKIFGARKDKDGKLYIDPVESQIKATFLATRLAAQNAAKKTAAQTFGVKLTAAGAKSPNMVTLSYMHKGKKISVAVPKEIKAATLTLDSGTFQMYNAAVRTMAKATGVFRVGTTTTPTFGVVNFFRDQLIAWIQTPGDVGFCPFVSAFKGLSEMLKTKVTGQESAYTAWLKDGGSNSTLVSLGRDFTQRTIQDIQRVPVQNMLKEPGKYYKDLIGLLSPVQLIKRSYRGLEAFTEYTDAMTRVGVYMNAKKAGYSGKESAYLSRMATVDFARAGATVKGLNSLIAFLNARVQGMARIIETAKGDPVEFFDKTFRGVVIPSFLLALVRNDYIQSNQNPEDPYYDIAMTLKNAPDWMKQAYWLVPVPAIDSVIRIPKPYELSMAFAAPVESLVDYMYKLGSADELSFLEQLEENGFLSGVYDTMLPNVIPTPMLAPLEVMTNYSFFTGNNIIPAYLEGTVPALQYKPGTSTTAKWISEQLFKIDPTISSNANTRLLSPMGIDHLVRGWGGAIGQSLVSTLDTILETSGAYDAPVKPAQRIEDFPFFKTFMVKYPSLSANDINKFNEERTELQNRYNAIMQGLKSADPHAQAIAQTLATSTAYANFAGMSKAMSQMAKAAQMINLTNDDPESKRLQLENVYIQMIQLASEGRKVVRQLKKEMRDAGR